MNILWLPAVNSAAIPTPIDLDAINPERARSLTGRFVVASFVVATPPDTFRGQVVVGAAEREDEVSRVAVITGNPKLRLGQRVAVVGRLRVIDHRRGYINGMFVPAWVEIRPEGRACGADP